MSRFSKWWIACEARAYASWGPIINDPGAGSFADFEDPDGNWIYLWETNRGMMDENAKQYSHA